MEKLQKREKFLDEVALRWQVRGMEKGKIYRLYNKVNNENTLVASFR